MRISAGEGVQCPASGRISCIRCMHPQGGVRAQPSHHPAPTAGNLALNTSNWFLITFEGDQFRYHHYLHLDTTYTRNEIQHTIDHGLRKPFTDIQAAYSWVGPAWIPQTCSTGRRIPEKLKSHPLGTLKLRGLQLYRHACLKSWIPPSQAQVWGGSSWPDPAVCTLTRCIYL